MKKLITMANLTFTKKNCNCGLQSNNTETSNTNKINLSKISKKKQPISKNKKRKLNFYK